jgi:2,4-dichlorophenol 6-monooxygenase
MLPGASEAHNRSVLEALMSDTPDGETRRSQLREMLLTLRREFQHAGLDLGVSYAETDAIVPDDSVAPAKDPTAYRYEPTTKPGHRLPHAWLTRDGVRVATHDLLGPATYLLLAGTAGSDWVSAAEQLRDEHGLDLVAYRVGPDCELEDPDDSWYAVRGHDEGGAVLVRPDGHVAYRSESAPTSPIQTLCGVLNVIVGEPRAVVPDIEVAELRCAP